jgi:hypothetical protein
MAEITKRPANGVRITDSFVPPLSQMIRDGQASAAKIKRASAERLTTKQAIEVLRGEAIAEWFGQFKRLTIAIGLYGLRGSSFMAFAKRIRVDQPSAFSILKGYLRSKAIRSRCNDLRAKAIARGELSLPILPRARGPLPLSMTALARIGKLGKRIG